MKRFNQILISLLFTTLLSAPVWAAKVKAVKGNKAQIDLEGDSIKVGDTFSVIGADDKVIGAVKITAVKGNLALAMLKGKASPGSELKARAAKSKKADAKKSNRETPTATRNSRFGAMVGFNSTSSDVTITSNSTDETLGLSGSGFSAKGFYDYNLMGSFWFRGLFGLEQFNIGGETNSECGGECIAEINYLTADLWGRLSFGMGWFGGGFSLLIPMSKDTTAFDDNSIATTSAISFGGGLDFDMGSRIIPIQLEYNIYPETERVTASAIAIRAGMSF
jgi:hypothetical protein